ncbi:hypothetical protein ACFFP0_19605 [Rhizobium puerariae]|uniref:PepSY domain-containing protein n=1 Tax=Rhizobium puerariae TaxID=1585791 RepID=A0ABV6AKA8_9HYPH
MRAVLAFLFAAAVATASSAEDAVKIRPASEAEIRQNLKGAGELTDGKDGYQYRKGKSTGYKISDGRICVRKPRTQVDCVDVLFNGKELEIVDRRGNRETLK